jgi:hypothetical protein
MAKMLICYCDSVTYHSFAKNRNVVGTYSFEDWCQVHADWMNHLYAQSVYPKTVPNGIQDRMCVDFIGVLPDDKANEARWSKGPTLSEGWDGGWWFGRNADCSEWAAGMDWGLIHEWGHQMGLTDLYALDVAQESNHVLDSHGNPLLMGRMSSGVGTMMHGHGPVLFSEDQAIALNHQKMRRRGYFGDYYYNLAAQNYVLITDSTGKPVEGAKLEFWQREEHGPGFSGTPTFSGTTTKDGRFLLPNRPAPSVITVGELGYQQKPNPFGQINVVGGNGVFFIKIVARGQTDYAFLDIPQFNVQKERESAPTATLVIQTQLPVAGASKPPASPTAEQDGAKVTLTLPGVKEWTAFRADPLEYLWKPIGESKNGTVIDSLPGTGLYRYASTVNNSARSEPRGVASMIDPWGLALAPDGSAWIRDRSNGQSLLIRPDGSAVGFLGSVHWHLEGSYDHATDADGKLYIAQWPHGYDPTHTRIRRVEPLTKSGDNDRTDMLEAEWKSDEPGHLKEPMGVWISPADKTIVVADTGNNRVQILVPGAPQRIITGLSRPHKAMLIDTNLIVCDTGTERVAIFDSAGKQIASIDGFEEPIYLCAGPADDVWIADRKLGRIFAINTKSWKKLDWSYPPASQPAIPDLRGIAYDAKRGDMLYIDGTAKRLVRRKVLD